MSQPINMIVVMLKTFALFLTLTATLLWPQASPPARAQDLSRDEAQVWSLEKTYWEYVKANDIEKYRALWHDDFVGWPSFSPTPVRKDHITDWMTNNASKGVKLQSYEIEQLAIKVAGKVAIDHYRIKMIWGGSHPTDSSTELARITHTWIKTGKTWQIIGGMSAPVNAEGK